MIPVKKTDSKKVATFCQGVYNSISETDIKKLDDLVYNNFKSVIPCVSKEIAFLQLMMLEYDKLKELKKLIDASTDKSFSATIKINLSSKKLDFSRDKFLRQIYNFIDPSLIIECNNWLKENKFSEIKGVAKNIDLFKIMSYEKTKSLKLVTEYIKEKRISIPPLIEKMLNRFEKEEEYIDVIYEHLDNDFKVAFDEWLREKSKDSVDIKVLLEQKNQKSYKKLFSKYSFETEKELKYEVPLKEYFQIEWKSKLESYYNKIDKKELVRITGVTVCPYCYRNFINVTEEANTSQLDHFFSKSEYPLLALCFYNLVPSCYGCNNKKRDKKFFISPYDESIGDLDSLLNFSFQVNEADIFTNKDSIKVVMKYSDTTEGELLKEAHDILSLETLYELHNDVIQELLWKSTIYTESYREKLSKILNGKLLSNKEMGRIITGAYTCKEDYGKRPLSKMVTEISKEIGLVGEE